VPIKNPLDGIQAKKGVEWDPCRSFIAVSCLYFPYWSPNHPARPLNVYADPYPDFAHFRETPPNPNNFLVAAQQALLCDQRVNFQARGSDVLDVYDRFRTWYLDLRLEAGETLRSVNEDGLLSGDDTFAYDDSYDKRHEYTRERRFYKRSDGLIEAYGQRADPAAAGFRAPENLYSSKLAVTLAQYNTIVSQTKAFFTARRRFLENVDAMKALVDEGNLRRYDPAIRKIIEEQAAGPTVVIRGVKIPKKPRRKQLTDLTGAGEDVVDAAAQAMQGKLSVAKPKRKSLGEPKPKRKGA
jgi:hypothetical protein